MEDGAAGEVEQLRAVYCTAQAPEQLQHFTSITCMGSIKKNMDEWDATSCLFVGTESAELYVLNANGSAVKTTTQLPSVPVCCGVHRSAGRGLQDRGRVQGRTGLHNQERRAVHGGDRARDAAVRLGQDR